MISVKYADLELSDIKFNLENRNIHIKEDGSTYQLCNLNPSNLERLISLTQSRYLTVLLLKEGQEESSGYSLVLPHQGLPITEFPISTEKYSAELWQTLKIFCHIYFKNEKANTSERWSSQVPSLEESAHISPRLLLINPSKKDRVDFSPAGDRIVKISINDGYLPRVKYSVEAATIVTTPINDGYLPDLDLGHLINLRFEDIPHLSRNLMSRKPVLFLSLKLPDNVPRWQKERTIYWKQDVCFVLSPGLPVTSPSEQTLRQLEQGLGSFITKSCCETYCSQNALPDYSLFSVSTVFRRALRGTYSLKRLLP